MSRNLRGDLHCRPRASHSICTFIICGLAAAACAPDIPYEAPPDVVVAWWNPVSGDLPTPTNLARDEVRGQLDLPLNAELSAAELEFRGYLNSLDGYPLSSTMTIPTSAAISQAGLGGAFVAIDTQTRERLALDVTTTSNGLKAVQQLTESLESGMQPGRTYAFGLRGYDGGARGAAGQLLVADAPFYLIRTDEDLRRHPYAVPGDSRHVREENAASLDEVRREYLSLYGAMADRGIPRDEIAVASVFTTTARPSLWFDADRRLVPVPNGLLVDPDTGLVDIEPEPEDDDTTISIKHAISENDGGSTSGAMTFEATMPIDAPTVNAESVRLLRIGADGAITDEFDVDVGVLQEQRVGYLEPRGQLVPDSDYVFVVTRDVTAGGRPVEAQPITAFLRSRAPLVVGGESTISSLDNETAERLEHWRAVAMPALDWLQTQGTLRSELSVVSPFRTLSTLPRLHELRTRLYTDDISTEVTNIASNTPGELVIPLFDVETVVTGTFEIQDYLDPRTRNWRADSPQPTMVEFVLTIPEDATPGVPIPVVLFGHGLLTSRELVYFVADELARAGFAAFSFDLPYHGRRSVCLRNEDCTGAGTCDDLGVCSTDLAAIASPIPSGPEYPASTGTAFIEPDNIVGARDHFMQSAVDMFQALRVIRGADWAGATGGFVLDADDVVYMGMSLGGILGSIVAGAEPTIADFVLNVPGGDLFVLIRDSTAFTTTWQNVLQERNALPGTDDYFALEAALRWMLDPIDPVNVARYALDPYDYVDPVDGQTRTSPRKRVLIQMAVGDDVVPNSSTRRLSEAMGVPITEYTPAVSNHVFLFDPLSPESARARSDAIDFLEAR